MSTKTAEVPDGKPKSGQSDDKCIGNRRIRTIILCLILLGFAVFAAGRLFLLVDDAEKVADSTGKDGYTHSTRFIVSGLIITMFFLCVTMILLFIPSCNPSTNKAARLPGIGLLLGATLYLGGWAWYISTNKDHVYDALPNDDARQDADATYLSWFGEALLFGATTALIAIDMLIPSRFLFDNEYNRLFSNLGVLCINSILIAPAYFILDKDGTKAIGAGYIIIAITTAVYVILYITTCCTCDCKDLWYMRAILALGMIIGGIVTSVGYYVFAGGHETLGESSREAKIVAYYIGYTIIVGGLCAVWGLDIAWDDIKGNNVGKK